MIAGSPSAKSAQLWPWGLWVYRTAGVILTFVGIAIFVFGWAPGALKHETFRLRELTGVVVFALGQIYDLRADIRTLQRKGLE